MLKELMEKGYPDEYNCAEKIINGANEAYHLGLDLSLIHIYPNK